MVAAGVFCVCTAIAVAFQWALAAGAPWSHLTMGGHYAAEGPRLPASARVACVVQSALLTAMAVWIYHYAAGTLPANWPQGLVWVVVGISALSFILNTVTPSASERKLWMPVTFAMLVSCTTVALQGTAV